MMSQSIKDYVSRIVSKSIKAVSDVHHFPYFYIVFYVLINIFLVLKIAQMLLATGWILWSNLTWEFVPTDLNKER